VQPVVIAAIAILFAVRCPTAVVGFVVPVVILSLNGILRPWSSPHVSEKVKKVVTPMTTDLNTPTTVARVSLMSFAITAGEHRSPDLPLDAPNSFGLALAIPSAPLATLTVTSAEIVGANLMDLAAPAPAPENDNAASSLPEVLFDFPQANFAAREIIEFRRCRISRRYNFHGRKYPLKIVTLDLTDGK
jgi:hypothetical protein